MAGDKEIPVKAEAFLNHLASSVPFLRVMSEFTKNTWDDLMLEIGEKIAGDDERMEQLAKFLRWTPIFSGKDADLSEPELPGCFEDRRVELVDMRGYFQTQVGEMEKKHPTAQEVDAMAYRQAREDADRYRKKIARMEKWERRRSGWLLIPGRPLSASWLGAWWHYL